MSDTSSNESAIFNGALALPAEQRASYLKAACGNDAVLRKRVEGLLAAHEQADESFLENKNPRPGGTVRLNLPSEEKPGTVIGRYRLLEKVGEGGFGAVYVAEQREPVKRRVALKIIKLGMDTRQVVARFEAERQALALMDHPNIAKVLDAGSTETGRPFFVMELVRGIKITEYCDQNKLPTEQRIQLFAHICHAIQHAHQKGIIHRDIKPSNILVTLHDGVPIPKVIDFGIAKATQGELTDKTVYTQFQQFIGTPAYMSPEQAEMSGLDIDTRSDIYSLGVLLYELLTGRTPFDQKELLEAGLDGMRKMIREFEPLRPSTRVNSLQGIDRTTTAQRRQTEPPKLIHSLRGDLDWIVMKCLEKDRTRRYETANGLAMDLQRFLQSEPVTARPPSRLYRFGKLARRNKLAFAAAGAVITALLIGLGISTYAFVREKRASAFALASAKAARLEADKREQMVKLIQDMFGRVSTQLAQGKDTTKLREIVNQTITRFTDDLKNQPAVEAELRAALATIFFNLGDYASAEAMGREAFRLKQLTGEADSKGTELLLSQLANVLMERGELDQAAEVLTNVLALEKKLYGEISAQYADPLVDLGLSFWMRGELIEAEQLARRGLDLKRKLPGDKKDLAASVNNLGLVLWEQGRFAEAEPLMVEANGMSDALLLDNHPEGAYARNNLALVFRDRGDLLGAEKLFRDAVRLLPEDHPLRFRTLVNLGGAIRRRAALSSDLVGLREALQLTPSDPLTADALTAELSSDSLIPLTPASPGPIGWRFTTKQPRADWIQPDFADKDWLAATAVSGIPTYVPASPRIDRSVRFHTNFWLRREFTITNIPIGEVVLRLNRCHDAQVFINGTPAAPNSDWSDATTIVPLSEPGKRALKIGRNVIAVACRDADGGTSIDAVLNTASNPRLGRQRLIKEFDQLIQKEPQRADFYAGRGNTLARLGKWAEAISDFNKAIALEPQQLNYRHQLAPLLVKTASLQDYIRLRGDAVNRFPEQDTPSIAGQLAVLLLLQPLDSTQLEFAAKLADRAGNARYADKNLVPRQIAKGLSELRQARYPTAIEWMQKVQSNAAKDDLTGWTHERQRNRTAIACFVEAIAQHRLSRPTEARTALDKGKHILTSECPDLSSSDAGREWHELLIAQVLAEEAASLIERPAAGGGGRARLFRAP